MRVLAGWDDANELDLMATYLEAADNELTVAQTPEQFLALADEYHFDIAVFPVTFPDAEQSFTLFRKLRTTQSRLPMLLATRPGEVYPLSKFIRFGLHAHIYRDPQGEYLFLLQTLLESTVAAQQAEESRRLAERLREEVDSVRRLQESIIPKDLKALPHFKVVARYEPSQIQVADGLPVVLAGGDYYDVFPYGEKGMAVLVGDASGHGIKACMSIMSMHTLINMLQNESTHHPHEFVEAINRRLCAHELIQRDGGFITVFYGKLQDEVLHWSSAGHCLPLLQDLATGKITEVGDPKEDGGAPLAVFDDAEYNTISTPIPRNHRLLIYTDGLPEAFPEGKDHHQYGTTGMHATLERCRTASLNDTLQALFDDSYAYTHGAGRHDDTSVVLIEHQAH